MWARQTPGQELLCVDVFVACRGPLSASVSDTQENHKEELQRLFSSPHLMFHLFFTIAFSPFFFYPPCRVTLDVVFTQNY